MDLKSLVNSLILPSRGATITDLCEIAGVRHPQSDVSTLGPSTKAPEPLHVLAHSPAVAGIRAQSATHDCDWPPFLVISEADIIADAADVQVAGASLEKPKLRMTGSCATTSPSSNVTGRPPISNELTIIAFGDGWICREPDKPVKNTVMKALLGAGRRRLRPPPRPRKLGHHLQGNGEPFRGSQALSRQAATQSVPGDYFRT